MSEIYQKSEKLESKPQCYGNIKSDSPCRGCSYYQECLEISMSVSIAISERDY